PRRLAFAFDLDSTVSIRPSRWKCLDAFLMRRGAVLTASLLKVFGALYQSVTDTELGDESRIGCVVIELLAELACKDTQVLDLGSVGRPPHLLQDRPVSEDTTGIAGEQREERELLGRQFHQTVAHVQRVVPDSDVWSVDDEGRLVHQLA